MSSYHEREQRFVRQIKEAAQEMDTKDFSIGLERLFRLYVFYEGDSDDSAKRKLVSFLFDFAFKEPVLHKRIRTAGLRQNAGHLD